MYVEKIYKTGKVLWVEKRVPRKGMKGQKRKERKKPTPEDIKNNNWQNTIRKLGKKLSANFKGGDYFITLTYRKEERPTPEESKEIMKSLITILRKIYKKVGKVLKYVYVTENPLKSIHHHLVINDISDVGVNVIREINKLWTNGRVKSTPLYEDGYYGTLAAYLLKDWDKTKESECFKQCYSCSKNLHIPEPKKRARFYKSWRAEPTPPKGYYIIPETLYNGMELKTGYPIQRYVLAPLEERGGGLIKCPK